MPAAVVMDCREHVDLALEIMRRAYKDAVMPLVPYDKESNRARNKRIIDARLWIKSESEEPLSFCWYCQYMGINYGVVRAAVLRKIAAVEEKEALQ